MKDFFAIEPGKLNENVFDLLGNGWMLVTAGTISAFNTMTASWGGMGVLWNKNVCYIVIRPQRHTYTFLEKSQYFTLSFFHEKYREVLKFCGARSGRDVDKMKETGITPVQTANGSVCFSEARIVIECKKVYYQDIDPKNFIDESIGKNYPDRDYHRMYIGEIVSMMIK
ncbi:MAG TPA: flavin reductase family protein [Spirochaetota bacterium]|nr:flavin reductase family protein [Spirochaetota bacterium]HPN11957.1 flavin reductase family protein [Spirochaetota bacterium]HQL83690.1 flavin reductase family protein [Spirochaetota bacterium]